MSLLLQVYCMILHASGRIYFSGCLSAEVLGSFTSIHPSIGKTWKFSDEDRLPNQIHLTKLTWL